MCTVLSWLRILADLVCGELLTCIENQQFATHRDGEPAQFGAWVENACLAHDGCGTAGELLRRGTARV
jgi:hypothetical protein